MIHFDEATHTYTLDGQVIPSVTRILQDMNLIDSAWFTEYARLKGTYTHDMIHLHETDDLDERFLDPILKERLQAYKAFKSDSGFICSSSEKQMFSESYRFAGTADLFGTFRDVTPVLIDIKGSVVPPYVGPQTAAYELLEGTRGRKRFALQLFDDGKYKLHPLSDRKDREIFLSCLAIWHWRKNHKLI